MEFLGKIKEKKIDLILILFLTLAQFLCIPAMFLKSVKVLPFFFALLMLQYLVYDIGKNGWDEDTKSSMFSLFRISFVINILAILNIPVKAAWFLAKELPFGLFFMCNVLGALILFGIFTSEKGQDKIGILKDQRIFSNIDFSSGESDKKGEYSVYLCKDIDSKKKVFLNEKDRFLHTLILGATGSGKTSQIVIPMIWQDLHNNDCGITVLEPKSDLAEKVYAMAKLSGRDCFYFNPLSDTCPYFNPLFGDEDIVIENMVNTFNMLSPDSQTYFRDMNEQLLRNSLKLLKRLKRNRATLIDLSRLVQNPGGEARNIVNAFSRIQAHTQEEAKENLDIAKWFLNDYLNEKSKSYESTSGLRSQITKLTSNKYLRKVLNPPNGENDINFGKHLKLNTVMALTTCQGELRDLGRYLGLFLILQFQSAVFKRPGDEDSRSPHSLYIDEFQVYSNPAFGDMLTQGRSYRVASHLATQARDQIAAGGGKDGKNFLALVDTNARNIIAFPDLNVEDSTYFSKKFGTIERLDSSRSKSTGKTGILGLSSPLRMTDSVSTRTVTEARYSDSDLIYGIQFTEIYYSIIKDNSRQKPGRGKIDYIDPKINKKIKEIVKEYNEANGLLKRDDVYQIYKAGDLTFVDDVDFDDIDRINEAYTKEVHETQTGKPLAPASDIKTEDSTESLASELNKKEPDSDDLNISFSDVETDLDEEIEIDMPDLSTLQNSDPDDDIVFDIDEDDLV